MAVSEEARDNFRRLVALAARQFGQRQFGFAAQNYATASRLDPGDFGAIFNQALSLHMLGRGREALIAYNRVRFGPSRLRVLLNLASLDPGLLSAAEVEQLGEAAAAPGTDPEMKPKLWFALGYVREGQGRWDEAFAAFAEGNRLKAATVDMAGAAAREAEAHERIRRDFSAAALARWAGRGDPSRAPIFVVGKPRSGSTLIEQILASHPKVQAFGETAAFDQAAAGQLYWPPADTGGDHFRDVAADYLKLMRALGWRRPNHFVDKRPQNFVNVGAIALTFPHAAIVHSARDPIDSCLSQFRHIFDLGGELTYDLGEIGRSYVRYRRLMDHWAEALPGRVAEVRYEDVVADPEGRIRWLVTEVCGLPWSDTCLRFFETERFVDTQARFDVRRPIFTGSVGRWKPYVKHLGPLIEALGPYAPSTEELVAARAAATAAEEAAAPAKAKAKSPTRRGARARKGDGG